MAAGNPQFHSPLHFLLFPLMAPGHIIPIIDIAKLLADRGLLVSLISTPQNLARFGSTVTRAAEAGRQIRLVQIPFPAAEAGLPQGCENLDALPSLDMGTNFFIALNLMQKEVEKVVDEMKPPPSCIISDMGLPWTTQIAEKLQIPRIIFHGTSCCSLLCSHNIKSSGILDTLSSESDSFQVPNLPDRIILRKSQVSGSRKTTVIKDVSDQILVAEKTSYGVLVNSFEELEKEYFKEYSKVKGGKVWCIGPVSFSNKELPDLAERGNQSAASNHPCLTWLDSQKPASVIYASLGSLARLTAPQMAELALGLEASGRPFIWALGGTQTTSTTNQFEEWISDSKFEERIQSRGWVIRGWAPQLLILKSPAVGGFLTHCGWNSTLEGITAGVPLVTWPRFADQFCNEKLAVEVLGVGVSMGVEEPVRWGEEEKAGLVGREKVKKAVETLMEDEEKRKKAKEMGETARRATAEGGSSHGNIGMLIEDIMAKYGNLGSCHN